MPLLGMFSPRRLLALTLAAALLTLAACHQSVHDPKDYDVTAQYTDLDNQTVAVLVGVSDHTNFHHPGAARQIAREVTRRISLNVPGVSVINPDRILEWQAQNPYWTARTPGQLIAALNVDRLVMVEVGEYRMTDPGDTNIKRGVISANINVVEADAIDPDDFGFSAPLRVSFPDEFRTKVGLVEASEQDIQTITVSRFTEEAAGMFYDHTITR